MKTMKPFLALAAILSVLALTAPVEAQSIYWTAGGSATDTNTVLTPSPATGARYADVFNYGSSSLYVAQNAVATAAYGANRLVLGPCEKARIFLPNGVTTLGVITASGTTATYKANVYYVSPTTSSFNVTGMPMQEQVEITPMTTCPASATTGLPLLGSSVASATAMPVPTGQTFHVTGTTSITSIVTTGLVAGAVVRLIFDGILTFTDGNNLKLAGNFVTTADDSITLVYDGTSFFELARSVN